MSGVERRVFGCGHSGDHGVSNLSLKQRLLQLSLNLPRFRGRDRFISMLLSSFGSRAIRLRDDIFLHLDCSEWIQVELLSNGQIEPQTIRLFKKLIEPGDSVIDVGAHVGFHSVHAARCCGDTGNVLAIDPQPYNVDRIARNANCNSLENITAICAAISNCSGFIKINLQDEKDRARLSISLDGPNDYSQKIEVPVRTLKDLLERHQIEKIKVLKIDVEGCELQVLEGLGDKIECCENIIFEVLSDSHAEDRTAIFELLSGHRYEFFDVLGRTYDGSESLIENNCWARIRRS